MLKTAVLINLFFFPAPAATFAKLAEFEEGDDVKVLNVCCLYLISCLWLDMLVCGLIFWLFVFIFREEIICYLLFMILSLGYPLLRVLICEFSAASGDP